MPESLLEDRSFHSQQESDCLGTCLALCCGCCCCFSLMNNSNMWCLFRSCSGRRVPAEGEDDAASITYPDDTSKKTRGKPASEQPGPQPTMTPA